MSVKMARAFGPLFATKYDRPWLRYIVDGGDGVVGDSGDVEKPQGDEAKQDSTDWKAESRKWEARAKDNKEAADELAKLREAQKSEEEKRAEREAEKDRELAAYKLRDQVAEWSAEIVKDSHIPASALRGSTREELEAHFKDLSALIPKPADEPVKKASFIIPDDGGQPAIGRQDNISPGMGTLRAAYAQGN